MRIRESLRNIRKEIRDGAERLYYTGAEHPYIALFCALGYAGASVFAKYIALYNLILPEGLSIRNIAHSSSVIAMMDFVALGGYVMLAGAASKACYKTPKDDYFTPQKTLDDFV